MFAPDQVDERAHYIEGGELGPTPAHALAHVAVAHGVADGAHHPVRLRQLVFFRVREDERPARARRHGMQVGELAAAHLVHPHPFVDRAEKHDLLGHVLQAAQSFARLLETLGGARRQVAQRRLEFGALARIEIQVRGPIALRWSAHSTAKLSKLGTSRLGAGGVGAGPAWGARSMPRGPPAPPPASAAAASPATAPGPPPRPGPPAGAPRQPLLLRHTGPPARATTA